MSKVPPLCPERPHKPRPPRPHRERPPRPPRPQFTPLPKPERPPTKWPEGSAEFLHELIEKYRQKRKDALDTIRHFRSTTRAMDVAEVRMARMFLDNWRGALYDEMEQAFPGVIKPPPKEPRR